MLSDFALLDAAVTQAPAPEAADSEASAGAEVLAHARVHPKFAPVPCDYSSLLQKST